MGDSEYQDDANRDGDADTVKLYEAVDDPREDNQATADAWRSEPRS
jgi:hypothetical protein